ncbi:hypothetical protein JCM33374_g3640 [Metschnikowia sp. JCM 33374]|nr:hypothetical protein JCM33374_g3640 [Metschnikowia sp. JCM 33374]
MSVDPQNPYRRQHTSAEEDFNTNSYPTFHIPETERIKYGTKAPDKTRWGISLLNPQSYSADTPQVRSLPCHYYTLKTLHPPENHEDSVMKCYMPNIQDTTPKNEGMGLPLTQHSRIPLDRYLLNDSSIEITKGNIPLLYIKDSGFPYSSKHPVTNSLDTLPQRMSKAPIELGPYSQCAVDPDIVLLEHKSEKEQFPGPRNMPKSPPYAFQFQDLSRSKPLCFEQYITAIIKNELDLPQDVQDSFAKLGPLLSNINSRNNSAILVEIFRKINDHISLYELFNLLYGEKSPFEYIELNPKFSPNAVLNPTYLKLKALKILCLILMTFQCPKLTIGYFPGVSVQTLRVPPATFHKILRNFLAIKIISDSVKMSDYPSRYGLSTSRLSIYKVYYIICQKLLQKYPTILPYPGFEKALILSQPKISKITNLIYPNIITKRLGKRGESKAHYVGLILNKTTVDQEISHLLELDIPQLHAYFKHRGENELVGQCKIDINTLNSATNNSDSRLGSTHKHREHVSAHHFWTPASRITRDQSMGPSIIWKDIWKP